MKNILLFLVATILTSCLGMISNSFDKEYYEETTKIKFPDDIKVVATADNGEFVTITIIDLNKSDCKKFIQVNKFESIYKDKNSAFTQFAPELIGLAWLDSTYRNLPEKNLLVREMSSEKGTGWTYYIDTLTCRLYCQINYPDWSGK